VIAVADGNVAAGAVGESITAVAITSASLDSVFMWTPLIANEMCRQFAGMVWEGGDES
jgi:hypothetical protein